MKLSMAGLDSKLQVESLPLSVLSSLDQQGSRGHILLLLLFFNVYLFLRETEGEQGRGREREGHTESEAGSRLCTEPNVGLELTNRETMT